MEPLNHFFLSFPPLYGLGAPFAFFSSFWPSADLAVQDTFPFRTHGTVRMFFFLPHLCTQSAYLGCVILRLLGFFLLPVPVTLNKLHLGPLIRSAHLGRGPGFRPVVSGRLKVPSEQNGLLPLVSGLAGPISYLVVFPFSRKPLTAPGGLCFVVCVSCACFACFGDDNPPGNTLFFSRVQPFFYFFAP